MPTNLLKKYPSLLEIIHLPEHHRTVSLKGIYNRDIVENPDFKFRTKTIFPIKEDGIVDMDRQFIHLTREEIEETDENNKVFKCRIFDQHRSQRLHWINHHLKEKTPENIIVFSTNERDTKKRQDVQKTYIYDKVRKYVIVLECQRNNTAYFLLSAYYFNRPYAEKEIKKKINRKLAEIV